MNKKQMCFNCKFWEQNSDRGTCKRFPPLQWFVGGQWSQPQTNFNQWCGEYKENDQTKSTN